ncbi:hypothetical protein ABIA39_007546 [Nocardia sp. GAS34]|uniref:hypothetical protein n=1 Tax=unclassified Nocardia TaxID=2637762 RepID=UPI003D1E59EA
MTTDSFTLHAAATPLGLWRSQGPSSLPDPTCLLAPPLNVTCQLHQLGQAGKQAAADVAGSALHSFTQSLLSGFGDCLRYALTWWTKFPSPNLASPTGEPGPVLADIQGYTSGLQVLLMIAGIMFAAARLALAKRGGVAGEAQETFLVFARAIFASMTFAAVVTVGTRAGDAFSDWVISDASRGDANVFATSLNSFMTNVLGDGLVLVIGLFGIISMLVQLVMLVVRQAFLILVVAALPIAAAAAGTGPGSQAYKRMLSWALAFLLWKPVGALVYALAFSAGGANSSAQHPDPQISLLALILLMMVAVILPALMRLIAPAVATLGGGGGAAAALAGSALGVGMGRASGGGDGAEARKVTENDGSAGGGNGGGAPPSNPPPPAGGSPGAGRQLSGGTAGGGTRAGATGGGAGAPTAGGDAGATAASPAGAASGGGTAAAAGAGPAGAAVAGAQTVSQGVQKLGAAAESGARDTGESGWDPDAPGPMEVRR